MPNIYERILSQTMRLNISGKELGALLGLKKSPLTDWKNAKSSPTLNQVVQMCDIFAVSTDYLLTGKDWKPMLPPDDSALLDLFHELPPDKQAQFLIYLKGYVDGAK